MEESMRFFASMALAVTLQVAAQSIYPGLYEELMAVKPAVSAVAEPFAPASVSVLPGRVHDNQLRDSAWIRNIDVNRLVHSFRNNAGVFASREGGYMTVKKLGGWESLDCDLRGHTAGHLLSAMALMYAATDDPVFKMKGDSIVSALAEVQDALGGGYLSAFPEELIDRNIRGKSVWAPWYTLHKIYSGLIDQYVVCGNAKALDVVCRAADWAYNKLSPLDDSTRRRMIRNEFGGVNEVFYNLYAVTGEPRYLELARFFYHNEVMDPLKEKDDNFGTKHTNTFIPKVIAEMRNYEITGDTSSLDLARFFWNEIVAHHVFHTGECSDKEHFFLPEEMSKHVSGYTGETCCTYNMLKLSHHLFCHNPEVKIADFYERALFNHILGQQDPESGMVCYFLPLMSGSHKVYSTPENSFWCCVGSGFESHSKYNEAIYYREPDALYVNQFIPSELKWEEKGVRLLQSTGFPYSDRTELSMTLDRPERFTLKLRYPSWCEGARLAVNGKAQRVKAKPGTYIEITRTWNSGDRVELYLPMRLHVETLPDDSLRGVVMYGPIVLAGQCGVTGMESPAPFSDPLLYNDYYTYDFKVPEWLDDTLEVNLAQPEAVLNQVSPLEFISADGKRLRPLFDTHRCRYVVYWKLK